MQYPNKKALAGLWKALTVAEATPSGGDFTVEGLDEVEAAIKWLTVEEAKQVARRKKYGTHSR